MSGLTVVTLEIVLVTVFCAVCVQVSVRLGGFILMNLSLC